MDRFEDIKFYPIINKEELGAKYSEKLERLKQNINRLTDEQFIANKEQILEKVNKFNICFKGNDDIVNLKIERDILFSQSNIPPLFRSKTVDNFEIRSANYKPSIELIKSYIKEFNVKDLANGRGFVFSGEGKVGTGKTHLACAIANYLQEEKLIKGIKFINAMSLSSDLKDSFDTPGVSELSILKEYLYANLLIIDDLGKENSTSPWAKGVIYQLINTRYADMLPTLVTTELNSKLIKERYDESIESRLRDRNTLVLLNGADQRDRTISTLSSSTPVQKGGVNHDR